MPGIVLIKMAENGDVTNFTPTAKIEGTWVIFFLPSFVLYFPTRKRTGTPTRDLGFGREVIFLLRQCATWEFRPAFFHSAVRRKPRFVQGFIGACLALAVATHGASSAAGLFRISLPVVLV